MRLNIYNQNAELKLTVSTSSSSTWNNELMAENTISVSFTHPAFVMLDVNDYVMLSGVKFSINKEYKPKQKSTLEYTYSVKFYGPEHDAQRVMYLNLTDGQYEPQFSLDGTPRAHLEKWIENMNRIYGRDVWSIGEVVEKPGQTIEYNNITCWDALASISETFETEWWADGYVMNFCRCERGELVQLGYMKGLTSLTQSENESDVQFFTRLIPLGSTKNIDRSRYGYTRLQLPDKSKYVDRNTQYGLYEHVEESAFAEIFPHYTGTVTTVRHEEKTDDEGKKFTVYYFHDEGMQFDPNQSEIAGLVKRISFQPPADLAGHGDSENGNYWFEANYNSETLEWALINTYPSDDVQIPGGNLVPKPGDKYIPWNFSMPPSYEVQAELDYEAAVNSFLEKYSEDVSKYGGDTDYIYIDTHNVPLQLGQRVRLSSDKYFSAMGGHFDTRMTKVVRKLDNLSMASIECTNQVGKGWKRVVEQSLANLQYIVSTVSSGSSGGGGSSSGTEVSDKLKQDILVNSSNVGYLKSGDVVLAGQTWEKILRNMLYKPLGADLKSVISTSTDVEYGTQKGYITYTATRNGQGAMKEAYYDDKKENKLNFSAENAGKQEAVRQLSGIYTDRETYKATVVYGASADGALPEKELTNTISVNVRRKWFAGVVSAIPTTSDQVRALKYSGLYKGAGNYTFDATDWKMVAICFPEGANLSKLSFKGYIADLIPGDGTLKLADSVMVKGANDTTAVRYNVWYVKSAIVNNVTNNGTITIS